jgi:hypothetical protein
MIGCAAIIGIVAFVVGHVSVLIANDPTFPHPLITGGMTGGMAFIAALILFARDGGRHTGAIANVRQALLDRTDVADAVFCRHFSNADPTLVIQIRRAISQFFDVPVEKVHSTENLHTDLQFDDLEPGFHSFIVSHVLKARSVEPQPFTFDTGDLTDIGDLTNEIQRVLDGFNAAPPDNDRVQ